MDLLGMTHLSWCARDCAGNRTGIHVSDPLPAEDGGDERVGVTVAAEQLAEPTPIPLVCLRFVDDHQATQYRLPVARARSLSQLLRQVSGYGPTS